MLERARCGLAFPLPAIMPADDRIRILEIEGDTPLAMLVNEAKEPWAFLPGEIWNQSEYMTAWGLEMMMVSGCRAAISRATRV